MEHNYKKLIISINNENKIKEHSNNFFKLCKNFKSLHFAMCKSLSQEGLYSISLV